MQYSVLGPPAAAAARGTHTMPVVRSRRAAAFAGATAGCPRLFGAARPRRVGAASGVGSGLPAVPTPPCMILQRKPARAHTPASCAPAPGCKRLTHHERVAALNPRPRGNVAHGPGGGHTGTVCCQVNVVRRDTAQRVPHRAAHHAHPEARAREGCAERLQLWRRHEPAQGFALRGSQRGHGHRPVARAVIVPAAGRRRATDGALRWTRVTATATAAAVGISSGASSSAAGVSDRWRGCTCTWVRE